ncbi:holo-ACP synthase [Chloroflexota bacterium]
MVKLEMNDSRFGIGVDIESIERFTGLTRTRNRMFLGKIFTPDELDYCYSKRTPAPHLAVRFAGKEAVIKALYSLGRPESSYRDVTITNDENGVPVVKLTKPDFGDLHVKLSLSHGDGKGIAFAVILGKA